MIIWGHSYRRRPEERGTFICPACDVARGFTLVRTWRYLHIYWVPVLKQTLLSEEVICDDCSSAFPITVLVRTAQPLRSAYDAGREDVVALADQFGNVVEFTDAACDEIRSRHARGGLGADAVVRIEPDAQSPNQVKVAFDYALADGRDVIGQSQGISVVVDRRVAPELVGATIDFRGGTFVRR